jgi:hypothetical protein
MNSAVSITITGFSTSAPNQQNLFLDKRLWLYFACPECNLPKNFGCRHDR